MEHPIITRLNNYGYLEKEETTIGYYGEEIYLNSDNYIEFDGDIFLEDNLKRYLLEIGFKFNRT